MLAKILSAALVGLDAVPVTVEVDIASKGLPSFTIVGLPGKAVEESKERVRAALKNSGAEFPAKRITVNLAPADLPKNGPAFDLPIAIGILIASGQVVKPKEDYLYYGELSLDGTLCQTNGILSVAELAQKHNVAGICIPSLNASEAAIIGSVRIYPVQSLLALFMHVMGTKLIGEFEGTPKEKTHDESAFEFDFSDIQGQEQAKRALEIAAAGAHNVLMHGSPGAGKTMLARSMPSILPHLNARESVEVTKIYSVTGNLPPGRAVIYSRPFRAPHHTTSRVGLIGGGTHPVPGEISLAHRGVLFLDEFPEFPRSVLEALRQPLEDGYVHVSRAAGSLVFPAKFMLMAAANPCPCGYYGSQKKACTCPMYAVQKYQKRISGPIIDRIDMHVPVYEVQTDKLIDASLYKGETSETIRKRVTEARMRQGKRFTHAGIFTNSEMSTRAVKEFCVLSPESRSLMERAVGTYSLSARSYYKVLKIARTIADIAGEKDIAVSHISEALMYRPKTTEL